MGFSLNQVDSLLKKAHEHAKKELGRDFYRKNENGQYERGRVVGYGANGPNTRRVDPNATGPFDVESVPRASLGEDMGHDKAIAKASQLSVQAIAKMLYMHESDNAFDNEYQVFLLRAQIYMMYRGVSPAAMHQQATATYYYYQKSMHERIIAFGPGSGIQTGMRNLTLIEESLRHAGIPLYEPATLRKVDDRFGIVRSPATGRVKESYVHGAHGQAPITPGNTLYLLEVWSAPSISGGLYVIAEVGGEIGKVSAKRGQRVTKGEELVRIRNPWVSSSLSLPHGTQGD